MTLKSLLRRAYRLVFAFTIALYGLSLGRTARIAPANSSRILVLRFGLLGDGILLTPALRLLRQAWPEARIDVLATPVQVPVFEPLPFVDRVHVWTAGDLWELRDAIRPQRWVSAWRTVTALRRERYDAILSCYGPLGSALALVAGAPRRIGYASEALPGTLTDPLPGARWDGPGHDAEYNVEVVRALGTDSPAPDSLVQVTSKARSAVAKLLPLAQGVLCVLHPGAANGQAKRWPVEYWKVLARRLAADGHAVIVVGSGKEDAARAASIVDDARHNLVDRTTLPELFAVIERASVFVSGDSGPMHAAVALGRPAVAIHGPTDPAINGPYHAGNALVVRHTLPCSPCYRLDRPANCPLGHTLCQRLIHPDAVYEAVNTLLRRQGT